VESIFNALDELAGGKLDIGSVARQISAFTTQNPSSARGVLAAVQAALATGGLTEEQFAMGSFKDAFMDVVIDAQDAQNNIADQMLKDPRIFGAMAGLVFYAWQKSLFGTIVIGTGVMLLLRFGLGW